MTRLMDGGVDTKKNISKYKGIYLVDRNSKERHTYLTGKREVVVMIMVSSRRSVAHTKFI